AGVSFGGPPSGSRCRHAVTPAWNDGERALPELGVRANLNALVVGSGKPGTPCERMQRANRKAARAWAWVWRAPEARLEVVPELPEDPHAPSEMAIATKTSKRHKVV